jgi:hypothetical protein
MWRTAGFHKRLLTSLTGGETDSFSRNILFQGSGHVTTNVRGMIESPALKLGPLVKIRQRYKGMSTRQGSIK